MNFSTIKTWLAGLCVVALVGCGGGSGSTDAGVPVLGGGAGASSGTVTALFTTAPGNLTVPPGSSTALFTIGGGKASYSVTTSNPSVASVAATGNTFLINGLAGGSATVSIKDAAGAEVTVAVTVGVSGVSLFSSAPASVTVAVGAATQQYTINGGSPPYSVTSNDLTTASVGINGSKFIINGVAGGKTLVTIKDTVGASVSIDVTVGSNSALYTTAPSQISVPVGVTRSYVIAGGAAPYVAASSDANVAAAVVSGAALTISGIASGSSNVVVRDANGTVVTIAAKVGSSASGSPLFTSAAGDIVVAAGTKPVYAIGGGTAPYIVGSSNSAVATADVSGTTLSIAGVAAGSAKIVVLDAAGARVDINVVVGTGPVVALYTTAPSSVNLANGASQTYSIGGGVGPYVGSSSNTSVAMVSLTGSTFTVAGAGSGAAQVSVFDSAGKSVSISIAVSAATAFFTTAPDTVSVSIGAAPLYTVGGGIAPYIATSSNASVATVSQGPGTLTIAGVAAGLAKVSVRDGSGAIITINVTVPAGPALSTTAPSSVTIAPSAPLNEAFYVIAGGVPPYLASSANATVVEATVSVAALKLKGVTPGSSIVQVRDSVGSAVSIAVTVGALPALYTFAPPAVNLATGVSAFYGIGGGSPGYTSTSSDTRVASASLVGASVTIKGEAAGTATVTVRDAVGSSVLINVTVGSPIKLFVSAPAAVTVRPTGMQSYSVGGGEGPYLVASSNAGIATASVTASNLSITGVASGSASVVVSDALGATVTIAVTVTASSASPLTLTPEAVTASVGDRLNFVISGGDPFSAPTAPYTVTVQNASLMSATAASSVGGLTTFTAVLLNTGATSVIVTDSKGQTRVIAVTITNVQPLLRLSPSLIEISETFGGIINFYVSGGEGLLTAYTSRLDLSSVPVAPFGIAQLPGISVAVPVGLGTAGNRCVTTLDSLAPSDFVDVNITVVDDKTGRSAVSILRIKDNRTTCP